MKNENTTPELLFAVEFTDTFGGEANYCWIEKFCVSAPDIKRAITLAKQYRYHSPLPRHSLSDYGDGEIRIDIKGACVCAFISQIDSEEYSHDTNKTYGEIIN